MARCNSVEGGLRRCWVDIKRVAGALGLRDETLRSMACRGSIRARRVGPKLWRVWIDGEGLPGVPGCRVRAPGLRRRLYAEIGDAAAQASVHPETIRELCVSGAIRARKVGGSVWFVWLDRDGLPESLALPAVTPGS